MTKDQETEIAEMMEWPEVKKISEKYECTYWDVFIDFKEELYEALQNRNKGMI